MKVKLPILFNTDSTQSMQDADIDFDLRLCEIRMVVFYNIDNISPYFENDIEYTQINSGNMSSYSTLKISEVEQIIDKQKQLEFIN